MKTNKWKIVAIKNPRLRRVRKNLRTLLRMAYLDEMKRLRQLRDLYQQKRDKRKLNRSQDKRETMLIEQSNQLMSAYDKSILRCGSGGMCEAMKASGRPYWELSLDVDMVWNPADRQWYCLACYKSRYGTKEARSRFKKWMLNDAMFEARIDNQFGIEDPSDEIKKHIQYLKKIPDE